MIRPVNPCLKRLRGDTQGATIVEFAIVAPVFIMLLLGLFEFGFQAYSQSVLQGALQAAARNSTLEDGPASAAELDAQVLKMVKRVVPGADITFTRKNYANFEDVGQPEAFTDTNDDGICNNGEPFEDLNENGLWDADRGADGSGGARDAVLYTAVAEYSRMLPLAGLIDVSPNVKIEGRTVLRNQPFGEQSGREPVIENCS